MHDAILQHCHIILASTSAIRKEILNKTALVFDCMSPDFDEDEAKKTMQHLSLEDKAMELSCGKALSISKKFPQSYVIGSDQICDLNGTVISKSKNFDEAIIQLKKLAGKTHHQNKRHHPKRATCSYLLF